MVIRKTSLQMLFLLLFVVWFYVLFSRSFWQQFQFIRIGVCRSLSTNTIFTVSRLC